MHNLEICNYTKGDNEAALELEGMCPQGDSIKLRFVRTEFHRRSEVYEKSRILSAKHGGKLVGVAAGAEKVVTVNGKEIKSVYGYDLRVHPQFRKFGTAKTLTDAVIKTFGDEIDCNYTFVAAQNERALGFVKKSFGAQVIIPFVYFIIPVYRKVKSVTVQNDTAENVHNAFLQHNEKLQFVPQFNKEKLFGYIKSVSHGNNAGCSIWTNENLLAEQVVNLPWQLSALSVLQKMIKPFISTPNIPKKNEILKSWFLFDLFANDEKSLVNMISSISNCAYEQGKDYLYVFLQKDSPLCLMLNNLPLKMFTLPYYFLARGKHIPNASDMIYADIRDL